MSNEGPGDQQDLPWNDAPADSEAPRGGDEPDPAEVVEGEDGEDARDASAPRTADLYAHDTLDERLREEEPDRLSRRADAEGIQLVDDGNSNAELDEPDDDELPGAEEAALHLVDDGDSDL
jgi:hypothetical protein